MKWLALIGLVAFALWWLRSGERTSSVRRTGRSSPPGEARRTGQAALVRCGVCGLCLPESEALRGESSGTFYCSPAHRDDARRASVH